MQIKKVRLDMLLVTRGLADTRERAQALIAAGLVSVEGVRRDKCGHAYPPQAEICLLYTSPSPRDGATSRMPSSA